MEMIGLEAGLEVEGEEEEGEEREGEIVKAEGEGGVGKRM